MNLARYCTYVPAPVAAYHWIRDTFRDHLLRIQGGPRDATGQAVALIRALKLGACLSSVAVPKGEPNEWLGWSVSINGRLVFAYVRSELRRQGIGLELIGTVVPDTPIEAAYWTDDTQALADKGVPIRYSLEAYRSLLAFVRGPRVPLERKAA